MAYLNKVLLIGNLGKDPEIRVAQNGQKQARFTFATTERFKDKNTGEQKDVTQWHNITAWRASAEIIEKLNIKKGISLYIEGKITYRSWDDAQGQKKYMTEIELMNFQILTPRAAQGGQGGDGGYGAGARAAQQSNAGGYGSADNCFPDQGASGDDLPF